MRTTLVALAGVAVLTAVAGSAQAAPTLRTERVYAQCPAINTKVMTAAANWSTTAPSTSFTAGAGCGFAGGTAAPGQVPLPTDAVYEGKFSGNLSALTIELHDIAVGPSRTNDTLAIAVTVLVDGVQKKTGTATVKGVVSSTRLSAKYVLSVANLGLVTEEGNGSASRKITVRADAAGEPVNAWVHGATEVPAGITFNPPALESARIG